MTDAEEGYSVDMDAISSENAQKKVSLEDIALKSTFFNNIELQVVKQHSSPISPPPFMVGMAEVEVDTETGSVDVLDYVAVVDCGTPINPFGAKSIGELVIDTPCPALAEAIYNATGVRLTELPMTPEKIAMEILKNRESIRSGTKVEE